MSLDVVCCGLLQLAAVPPRGVQSVVDDVLKTLSVQHVWRKRANWTEDVEAAVLVAAGMNSDAEDELVDAMLEMVVKVVHCDGWREHWDAVDGLVSIAACCDVHVQWLCCHHVNKAEGEAGCG